MEPDYPEKAQAAGKKVMCSHCGSDIFTRSGISGFAGVGLVCVKCSHIEYFVKSPASIE